MDSLFESLYEKLNRIGRGTFGKVYKCRRRSDSAMFAVKEIDIEKDEVLQQTLKEITIMEKTQDTPYMIKYIQHFQMKDTILIVMELAEGGNLNQYLVEKQRLESEEIEVILYQLLLAVKQLHEMKIMHRDIKTENILKVQHGIKLGDLGLSTVVNGSLVGADSFNGTPIFNAPERFKKGYDFNVDIWSVGMVLYQLLQNSLPPYPEVYQGQRDPVDTHYPKHIRDILDDMLILDPVRRPFVHEVISKLVWSRSIGNIKLCFDGSILQGQRVNSLLQGKGICYYPNGDRYEGYWEQGNRHGFGTYFCVNGQNFNGNWINDQLPLVDINLISKNKASFSNGNIMVQKDMINQLQGRVEQLSQQNQILLNVRKDLISQLKQEKQNNVQLNNQNNSISINYQKQIETYKVNEKAAENQIKDLKDEQLKIKVELQQEQQKNELLKLEIESMRLQKVQLDSTIEELQRKVASNQHIEKINNELLQKLKRQETEQELKETENKTLQKRNDSLQKEIEKYEQQLDYHNQKQNQSNSDSKKQHLEQQSPLSKYAVSSNSNTTIYDCIYKDQYPLKNQPFIHSYGNQQQNLKMDLPKEQILNQDIQNQSNLPVAQPDNQSVQKLDGTSPLKLNDKQKLVGEFISVKQEVAKNNIEIGHRYPAKIVANNLNYNKSPAYPNLETPRERKELRELERFQMNLNGDVIMPLPPFAQLLIPPYLPPNNHELNHQALNNQDQGNLSEGFSSFMPKNGTKEISASVISTQLNIVAQQHPSFKTDFVDKLKKQKVNSNGLSNAERDPIQISESGKIVGDNLIKISSTKDIVGDVISDNKQPLKGKLIQDKDSQIRPKSQTDHVIVVEANNISINQSAFNDLQVQHQKQLPNKQHKMEDMNQKSSQVQRFIAQEDEFEEEKEEKISLWKCPKCQVLMQLNERCIMCNASIEDLDDQEGIQFDQYLQEASLSELASSQFHARNSKSKYLKETEKPQEKKVDNQKQASQKPNNNSEKTVTMWKCPACELCMQIQNQKCDGCGHPIKSLTKLYGFRFQDLILKVNISENGQVQKKQWCCPYHSTQDQDQNCNNCNYNLTFYARQYGVKHLLVIDSKIQQQQKQSDLK